jgi:hypothetical protein
MQRTSRRRLIEPHKGDKRYVPAESKGQFKTEVNVGRSLAADRRRKAKTKAAKVRFTVPEKPSAFHRADDEPLTVTMCISNPDRSAFAIDG